MRSNVSILMTRYTENAKTVKFFLCEFKYISSNKTKIVHIKPFTNGYNTKVTAKERLKTKQPTTKRFEVRRQNVAFGRKKKYRYNCGLVSLI